MHHESATQSKTSVTLFTLFNIQVLLSLLLYAFIIIPTMILIMLLLLLLLLIKAVECREPQAHATGKKPGNTPRSASFRSRVLTQLGHLGKS